MRAVQAVVAAVALVLSGSLSAQTVDVTGKWDMSVETGQGSRPGTLTITKAGDKLSGSVASPQGEIPIDVTLKERTITMAMSVQTQNGPLNVTFTGTVDGDTIKGDVDMGGRGTAAWSAKRAASASTPPQSGAQEKPAPTMTGTWAFEVHHSAGVSTPTVTITQTGEKLGGKYQSSYGQFELTGSIKGTEFTFRVVIGTEQTVELVYTGTLEGDTVKGNLTMGEMGEGTFTGKRK